MERSGEEGHDHGDGLGWRSHSWLCYGHVAGADRAAFAATTQVRREGEIRDGIGASAVFVGTSSVPIGVLRPRGRAPRSQLLLGERSRLDRRARCPGSRGARRIERIELGTPAVTPLDMRGPESIRSGGVARSIGLPLHRLLLDLGSPHPEGAEWRAGGYRGPAAEALDAPHRRGARPQDGARRAGEVVDGVLFNWPTPEYGGASPWGVCAKAWLAAKRLVPAAGRVSARSSLVRARAHRVEQEGLLPTPACAAYAANSRRTGLKPTETVIGVEDLVRDPARPARSGRVRATRSRDPR